MTQDIKWLKFKLDAMANGRLKMRPADPYSHTDGIDVAYTKGAKDLAIYLLKEFWNE